MSTWLTSHCFRPFQALHSNAAMHPPPRYSTPPRAPGSGRPPYAGAVLRSRDRSRPGQPLELPFSPICNPYITVQHHDLNDGEIKDQKETRWRVREVRLAGFEELTREWELS